MTTIAWDGKTLAADRRGIADYTIVTAPIKIFRTRAGHLCGAAGNTMQCGIWKRWLDEGGDRPASLADAEEYVTGIEIRPDASVWFHGRFGAARIMCAFHAIGSGAHFAIGAMAMGATADHAILVASQFDNSTGNGLDTLTLS